jgi:hypothetical protein
MEAQNPLGDEITDLGDSFWSVWTVFFLFEAKNSCNKVIWHTVKYSFGAEFTKW